MAIRSSMPMSVVMTMGRGSPATGEPDGRADGVEVDAAQATTVIASAATAVRVRMVRVMAQGSPGRATGPLRAPADCSPVEPDPLAAEQPGRRVPRKQDQDAEPDREPACRDACPRPEV